MARIVDAIPRKKIEDTVSLCGEQLCSCAVFVVDVHLQQTQQLDPMWIHMVCIAV